MPTNCIADARAEGWAIWADCVGCRRSTQLDTATLPPALPIAALEARLRCQACGAGEVGISIAAPSLPPRSTQSEKLKRKAFAASGDHGPCVIDSHKGKEATMPDTNTIDRPAEEAAIDREIAAYDRMRTELERHHDHKFVVIHGGALQDSFDTFGNAAQFATDKFGRGPFLIRQVGVKAAPPLSMLLKPLHSTAP